MIRVAVVGCGGISRAHFRNLGRVRTARVVACCDVDRARAEQAAAPCRAAVYTDWRRLLAEVPLDAVVLAIPPFAHDGIEIEAAHRGVHIFVEKPIALDLTYPKRVLAAVRKAGVICQVGYMWRYADITDRAKALLGKRRLGMALGHVITGFPHTSWWLKKKTCGSQMIEQATHIFDMLRAFGGEIREVFTRGILDPRFPRRVTDVEYCTTASLAFQDGLIGSVSSASTIQGGRYAVELIAEDAHLDVNYIPHNRITGTIAGKPVEFQSRMDWRYEEMRQFIRAIERTAPDRVRIPYVEGARTLAVTLAAEQSLQTRRPVRVARVG